MLGSLMSMAGYWLAMFAMVIWMVVRIARGSPGMAVLTFFVWPAALISLIKNWGDRDTDIRIPFFLALVAWAMMAFMAARTVDKAALEAAPYLTDEDIALIREEDPEMAARLEEARAQAYAEHGEEAFADGPYADYEDAEVEAAPAAPAVESTTALPAAPPERHATTTTGVQTGVDEDVAASLRSAVSTLAYRIGTVMLDRAHAKLEVPKRFRFLPREQLLLVAKHRGERLDEATLGWLVHQQVDLRQPQAWYVEVRYAAIGHVGLDALAGPDSADFAAAVQQAASSQAALQIGDAAFAPHWNAADGFATWSMRSGPGQDGWQAVAARPLRGGLLLFVMRGLAEPERELGLRATRLMVARSAAVPGWDRGDVVHGRDLLAGLSLAEWAARHSLVN